MMQDFNLAYQEMKKRIMSSFDRTSCSSMLNQEIVHLLTLLNRDNNPNNTTSLIPNMLLGELSICVDRWDGYSTDIGVATMFKSLPINSNNCLCINDFLNVETSKRYHTIVLVPPFGKHGQTEAAFLRKSLDLLAPNGTILVLLPQSILSVPAFKDLRSTILQDYSLEAVLSVNRISSAIHTECSILIIRNCRQIPHIYMSIAKLNALDTVNNYKNGIGGFFVDSKELYDRFDANFHDPQHKKARDLVLNRDTEKLHNLADIFRGFTIPAAERKASGTYLIIKPQYIYDHIVHFGNNKKVFCSSEYIDSDPKGRKYILKKGDILIGSVGKINWAIYAGDDDFAVANHNIIIIRGHQENGEATAWLNLFFSTNTGIEHFESQLNFLSHCGPFHHVSVHDICNISVPDIKMMATATCICNAADYEAKVVMLFNSLGWEVRENYRIKNTLCDIALFYGGCFHGIVQIKLNQSTSIRNNRHVANQLETIKLRLPDAAVYLFIDGTLYEYEDGILIQLEELPRPGLISAQKIKPISPLINENNVLPIEPNSLEAVSLSDQMLVELAIGNEEIIKRLDRIEGKVDTLVEKLEKISEQICGYQSLVNKQLELAVSPEEEERIIHAFSEECAERIIVEVNKNEANREYNNERQKLILSFGESAWNKIDDSSKSFLVSSKVIFNNLIGLRDIVDYSGVCLLVTKALEVEMTKRFCIGFIAYLKNRYPGKNNYAQFPTSLLDRNRKPIKPKHFTLGTVAYVLCYNIAESTSPEQANNNRQKLIEYTKEKLIIGKSDDEILSILHEYAESVEEIKNDYRNPSAHTNKLRQVDAKQCFDLVIDVEKLMIKMLDSFAE